MTHLFPTDDAYSTTYKWPWRTGEFGTMAFFAVLAAAMTWWLVPGPTPLKAPAAALAAIGAIYWLYRVKISRVTRSGVTLTITGTRIKAYSPGTLGSSAVDTAKVKTIGVRSFGSDECFMLSDGTQGARIPIRTTTDPVVRAALAHAWDNATTHSPEAQDLYGSLPGI